MFNRLHDPRDFAGQRHARRGRRRHGGGDRDRARDGRRAGHAGVPRRDAVAAQARESREARAAACAIPRPTSRSSTRATSACRRRRRPARAAPARRPRRHPALDPRARDPRAPGRAHRRLGPRRDDRQRRRVRDDRARAAARSRSAARAPRSPASWTRARVAGAERVPAVLRVALQLEVGRADVCDLVVRANHWFPTNLPDLLAAAGGAIAAAARRPAHADRNARDQRRAGRPFWYTLAYSMVIVVFGVRRIRAAPHAVRHRPDRHASWLIQVRPAVPAARDRSCRQLDSPRPAAATARRRALPGRELRSRARVLARLRADPGVAAQRLQPVHAPAAVVRGSGSGSCRPAC